jgi:hypothetical protein
VRFKRRNGPVIQMLFGKKRVDASNMGVVAKIYNVFRWSFLFVVIVLSIFAIYDTYQFSVTGV